MDGIGRRAFVLTGAAAAAGLTGVRVVIAEDSAEAASVPEWFPAHDPALAREVVGASHANLERVREIVERKPEIAKAAIDWGFGDWESAIDAASHTGRAEIAELLIAHGARPTLFTHAMLGDLAVVRATIEARPGVQREPGPHGISLLSHAQAGGERAAETAAYLESLGDAGGGQKAAALGEEEMQAYVGRYRFGAGDRDVLEVSIDRRGNLSMRQVEGTARRLVFKGDDAFSAAGADSTRIRFGRGGGGAVGDVVIHDPEPILRAVRE